LKELLIFLRNPRERIQEQEIYSNFGIIKKFILFCLFISLLFGLLIFLINQFNNSIYELIKSERESKNGILGMFYLIILYPIIEELGFRLALKIRKDFLSISLGVQLTYLCLIFDGFTLSIIEILILIPFFTILWFFIINKKTLNFLKNNYRLYFYFNISFFAVLHIFNYSFNNYSDYLFIPILILPPLLIGSYISFIRIKSGFFLGLVLHILYNFLITIPDLLKYLFYLANPSN